MSALGLDGVVGGDVEKSVSSNNGTYLPYILYLYLSVNPEEEMKHIGAGSWTKGVLVQPCQRANCYPSYIMLLSLQSCKYWETVR